MTTEPAQILARLDRLVAADPVGATVLGTIGAEIRAGRAPEAWCAVRPGTDALVVRSAAQYPALFTSGWDGVDLDAAIALVRELPGLVGVSGPVVTADFVAAALADGRVARRIGMRLFRLYDLVAPHDVPGDARPATSDDAELITDWYRAFADESHATRADVDESAKHAMARGRIWLWCEAGRPVSLAGRRAPEGGCARIGPVYTPPQHRGHGYGSAVTAAATQDILALPAIPVLFTDLDNPTSNKIYQQLGYYPVEDQVQIVFDTGR